MKFRSTVAYAISFAVVACGQESQTKNSRASQFPAASPSQNTGSTAAEKAAFAVALSSLTTASSPICKVAKSGIQCLALGRLGQNGKLWTAAYPIAGFGPDDLQAAYNIPTSGGVGVTVALIEYGDDPTAEDDLAAYRAAAGLKACTQANGCFRKVDEWGELMSSTDQGTTQGASQPASAPAPDYDWAVETALDLDMVSAACPKCNILLVEASEETTYMDDAGTAMSTAVALGAKAISNSWGAPEDAAIINAGETYFNKPGVSVFASSGDGGFGVIYPSSSQYVIAAGGTNLAKDPNTTRGWNEAAWNGAGSGCSAYLNKPAWQTDTSCPNRMIADVAAVADPVTGVAVYVNYYGMGGQWVVVGGTSVASPLLAGIWAASGWAGTDASFIYANQQDFNDVTSGNNGECTVSYECTATTGYDGPTGNGTPNASMLASTPVSGAAPACTTNADCAANLFCFRGACVSP